MGSDDLIRVAHLRRLNYSVERTEILKVTEKLNSKQVVLDACG